MRLLSRFLTPTHLPATCDAFSAHVSVPHSKPCRKHGSRLNPCLLIRVGMFTYASALSDCHKKAIHSSFSYQTSAWTVGWDGLPVCLPSSPPTPSPAPSQPPQPPGREDSIDLSQSWPHFKTVLRVTLSGDVASFDVDVQLLMRTAFATRVGVSISQVELSLAAASVSATYRTYSTSQAAMAQVQGAIVEALGDRVDVQAMLRSIAALRDSTVESDPAIDTEVDNRSNSGLVIGTAIGAAIGAAVLVVLVAVLVRRRKAESKNKTVPTPPTPGRLRIAPTWLSNAPPAPC